MKNKFQNAKLIILIFSMSMAIFILTFTALYLPTLNKQKALDRFSDFYVTFDFSNLQEPPTVEQIKTGLKGINYRMVVAEYKWSRTRAILCKSSTSFLENEMLKDGRYFSKTDYEKSANYAMVNDKYEELCLKKDGSRYICKDGVKYKVIGAYHQEENDIFYEIKYYLNLNAKGLEKNNSVSTLYFDAGKNTEIEAAKLLKHLKGLSSSNDIKYYKWNEHSANTMDSRAAMASVVGIVGVLVCINCMGFTKTWISSKKRELGIRRMLGASVQKNHIWLVYSYLCVIGISIVFGIGLAEAFYIGISMTKGMGSVKNLFGTKLYIQFVPISAIIVFLIGFAILEWSFYWSKRKKIVEVIR